VPSNEDLWREALEYLPGGVNSPVRACGPVATGPIFAARGAGSRIWDAEGTEYVDYVCSWGALILGHAFLSVVESACAAVARGSTFGMPTAAETDLARRIARLVPSVEKVRLVNSGTEAAMSAVRLARGVTGRKKVVKFEGCYHGHVDSLLAEAGSGAMTLAIPGTPGVPPGHVSDTLVAPFNDLEGLDRVLAGSGGDVACIIVEPVAGNMGVVPPARGFLEGLRERADEIGCLLIFDEVITGFRLAPGGYQELCGVTPDITTMGKVLGGGFPLGAFGGRTEIMDALAPGGPVYQAGTLSGNPVAVAAGAATLDEVSRPGFHAELDGKAALLESGIGECLRETGTEGVVNRAGSMLTLFFTGSEVDGYASARSADTERYAAFFRAMRREGVNLPPSQFEAWFVSSAHTEDDIQMTLDAARRALRG